MRTMNAHDTPSGTRMMWQASVNAICARAHGTGFTASRACTSPPGASGPLERGGERPAGSEQVEAVTRDGERRGELERGEVVRLLLLELLVRASCHRRRQRPDLDRVSVDRVRPV